jgi:large subunit ribosomal protein L29
MSQKVRRFNEALRAKDPVDLRDDLIKLRREQFSLRMQAASGQTVRTSDFDHVRKNIARLKTAVRARQLAAAKTAGAKK